MQLSLSTGVGRIPTKTDFPLPLLWSILHEVALKLISSCKRKTFHWEITPAMYSDRNQ
jgi:hypothetical protein